MSFRLGITAATMAIAAAARKADLDRFEKKIRPVLAEPCYACHSGSAAAPQGGLRLDSKEAIRRSGNSGTVIRQGNPDLSLLIRAIRHRDRTLKMPLGSPLPPEVVADFEGWVPEGAALPEDLVPAVKKQPALTQSGFLSVSGDHSTNCTDCQFSFEFRRLPWLTLKATYPYTTRARISPPIG